MTGLSREQELDFRGTARAWHLLCTNPQGYPVNPIKLRASRCISLEYWERQTPGPHQPRRNPLDLMLAAAVPSLKPFKKMFPGLCLPQHPCL